jgi:hypothetical protein
MTRAHTSRLSASVAVARLDLASAVAYNMGDYHDPFVTQLWVLGLESVSAVNAKPGSEGMVIAQADTYGGQAAIDRWLGGFTEQEETYLVRVGGAHVDGSERACTASFLPTVGGRLRRGPVGRHRNRPGRPRGGWLDELRGGGSRGSARRRTVLEECLAMQMIEEGVED